MCEVCQNTGWTPTAPNTEPAGHTAHPPEILVYVFVSMPNEQEGHFDLFEHTGANQVVTEREHVRILVITRIIKLQVKRFWHADAPLRNTL